jgi:hypothetical protein
MLFQTLFGNFSGVFAQETMTGESDPSIIEEVSQIIPAIPEQIPILT